VTATVYAHALPGRDDLAEQAWENVQKNRHSKPKKPARLRKATVVK
jgi:hypothetical protein